MQQTQPEPLSHAVSRVFRLRTDARSQETSEIFAPENCQIGGLFTDRKREISIEFIAALEPLYRPNDREFESWSLGLTATKHPMCPYAHARLF